MTPITITGALTMTSLNGDGAQLLTEAAEFLGALAQMGVQMAVEINLRPVGAETASTQSTQPTPSTASAQSTARGSADDITLYDGHPSLAAANPTPAVPAQPEEPQPLSWRKLPREQRLALLRLQGRELARTLGHPPTMAEWDACKPAEFPTASGLPSQFNLPWTTLAVNWASESV